MFRANTPVYITDSSYSNFKKHSTPFFQWNETHQKAIISHFKELDAKGEIKLYDQPADIIRFEYKDRPYMIFIHPNYIFVRQRIDSTISRENYSKIYNEMRTFVYNNITDYQFCLKFFPNIPECPVDSKRGQYQDAVWTFYGYIEGFSPEINENNLEQFKNFHPFAYLDHVKIEKIYGSNYLFFYADPREQQTILVNFWQGGSLSQPDLLYYMELTEILFAKAEQQKLEVKAEMVSTQKQINDLKNSIYTATDKKDIEHIKENLSNIDIENSRALKTLRELENLEELEQTIIDKKDDIFQRVYYEKIRRHKDTLSMDIEGLHSTIVELNSDREEARRLAEDKVQNEKSLYLTKIAIIGSFLLSFIAIVVAIIGIRTNNTQLENSNKINQNMTEKINELAELMHVDSEMQGQQTKISTENSQKIIEKLSDLVELNKASGKDATSRPPRK